MFPRSGASGAHGAKIELAEESFNPKSICDEDETREGAGSV